MGLSVLPGLINYFLSHISEVFNYNLFKYFLSPFLFLLFFWDPNIRIIGVPEEEEKKKGSEKIFEEIIVENFPNMGKEIVNQVQEAQRVPYRINARRNMPRHILIKLSKIKYKEQILKAAREKQQIT